MTGRAAERISCVWRKGPRYPVLPGRAGRWRHDDGEPNLNPGYLGLENVVLLPHLGSATVETRSAVRFLALNGIDAVLAGRTPPNIVT